MSAQLITLKQLATSAYQQLAEKYPQAASIHATPLGYDSVQNTIVHTLSHSNQSDHSILTSLNQEEKASIFSKLVQIADHPRDELPSDDMLYLEQQLSDLYSIPVSSNIESYRLPMHSGQIMAHSHQKRYAADQLKNHGQDQHALLAQHRPFYGWLGTNSVSSKLSLIEEYTVGLPLFLLEAWHLDPFTTARWFKHRPLLIINPLEKIACIAVVGDVAPIHQQRYQLTGSPELMRAGQFWRPGCQGRVAIFMINAPLSSLTVGVLPG